MGAAPITLYAVKLIRLSPWRFLRGFAAKRRNAAGKD